MAFFELDDWDKAIKYYGMAIKIDAKPRDHARIAMAYMEKCKKHYTEEGSIDSNLYRDLCKLSASHFDIYLRQDPGAPGAYYFDAYVVHDFIGNSEKAHNYLRVALEKDSLLLNKIKARFQRNNSTTGSL